MEYDIWIVLLSNSAHFEAVTFGSNPFGHLPTFLRFTELGWGLGISERVACEILKAQYRTAWQMAEGKTNMWGQCAVPTRHTHVHVFSRKWQCHAVPIPLHGQGLQLNLHSGDLTSETLRSLKKNESTMDRLDVLRLIGRKSASSCVLYLLQHPLHFFQDNNFDDVNRNTYQMRNDRRYSQWSNVIIILIILIIIIIVIHYPPTPPHCLESVAGICFLPTMGQCLNHCLLQEVKGSGKAPQRLDCGNLGQGAASLLKQSF